MHFLFVLIAPFIGALVFVCSLNSDPLPRWGRRAGWIALGGCLWLLASFSADYTRTAVVWQRDVPVELTASGAGLATIAGAEAREPGRYTANSAKHVSVVIADTFGVQAPRRGSRLHVTCYENYALGIYWDRRCSIELIQPEDR